MDSKLLTAKSVDMCQYLSSNGYNPVRENSRAAYYLSPFRGESNPSFVVMKALNRWADYGESTKTYDIIDFVSRLQNITTGEAIDYILKEERILFNKPDEDVIREEGIEVLDVKDAIENEALIAYMEEIRRIPIGIVNEYCVEVKFLFTASRYMSHYAVGQQNDKGGFSLRNTWWKGASKPAGVTTVAYTGLPEINLFEGFIDFLSHVVLYGKPETTCIILNSLVFIPMMVDYLQGLDTANLWLDLDAAADNMIEYMLANNVSVVDQRYHFDGYKDLNEKLQKEWD